MYEGVAQKVDVSVQVFQTLSAKARGKAIQTFRKQIRSLVVTVAVWLLLVAVERIIYRLG